MVDIEHIREIMEKRKLTNDVMAEEAVEELADMERADAQRLQPHHICSSSRPFRTLVARWREDGRFEITNAPVRVRDRDRLIELAHRSAVTSVSALTRNISTSSLLPNSYAGSPPARISNQPGQ